MTIENMLTSVDCSSGSQFHFKTKGGEDLLDLKQDLVKSFNQKYDFNPRSRIKNNTREQEMFDYMENEGIIFGTFNDVFLGNCGGFLTSPMDDIFMVGLSEKRIYKKNIRIITIAHELGHYIDFKFNGSSSFIRNPFTSKRMKISLEKNAWIIAFDILGSLQIDVTDEYNYIIKSLQSYCGCSHKTKEFIDPLFIQYQNRLKKGGILK